MDQEFLLKAKEQGLSVVVTITLVVVFYWLVFSFINKREWSAQLKYTLVGFFLGIPFPSALLFGHGEVGPGSGIVILFPIVGIVAGYIIGSIKDHFSK